MMHIKAVITGDLIGSTAKGADAIDKSMVAMANVANRLSNAAGAQTCFTRHRGDGWQIYLDLPGLCLRAALMIAAELRAQNTGLATRQSVGLGTVEPIISNNLSSAFGVAFEVSGSGLDHMDRNRRLLIGGRGIVTPMHEAIFALADWQSARWSREQAEAISIMLSDRQISFADGASTLGISRQAFQARLTTAGLAAWEEALLAFESDNWSEHPDA